MAKTKETEEQKQAKNLKNAHRAIYLCAAMFLMCVGLVCVLLADRHKFPSSFNYFDAAFLCGGLLYAAYGFSDAKYTLRTNGRERNSPGMALALFLCFGSRFGESISKHGLRLYLWPWIIGLWVVCVVFALIVYRRNRNISDSSASI